MFKLRNFCIVVSTLVFLSSSAYADKGGHGHGQGGGKSNSHKAQGKAHGKGYSKSKHKTKKAKADKLNKARFSDSDRVKINNFYANNPRPEGALPPGIAMNLLRGKPLPPGIEKNYLQPEVVKTLPQYPGYEYVVVGNDVVLVEKKTDVIADILSNVLAQ